MSFFESGEYPSSQEAEIRSPGLVDKDLMALVEDLLGVEHRRESAAEIAGVLERAEIHGAPFEGRLLTKEHLLKEGLTPRYKMKLGETTLYFSLPYKLGENRLGAVEYVEYNGRVVARSVYRSNSAGGWRYLPAYTPGGAGAKKNQRITWYAKGRRSGEDAQRPEGREESIGLPFFAQFVLAQASAEHAPRASVHDPEFIFAGTARPTELRLYESDQTSRVLVANETPESATVNLELNRRGAQLNGNFYKFGKPENMRFFDERHSPDFSSRVTRWRQNTSLYGEVEVDVFPSRDATLYYTFYYAPDGRAWIGGIEADGPLQSTGLPRAWVDPGYLGTPAFEYDTHSLGLGNPDLQKGRYIDMWKNFLSKIPVLQEYVRYKQGGASEKAERSS